MLHLSFEQMMILVGVSFMGKFIAMWAFALWQTDKDLKRSKERRERRDRK